MAPARPPSLSPYPMMTLPEVNELFILTLTSVSLAEDINGGRDFNFEGDESLIDSIPSLGIIKQTDLTILKNDDANGIISLTASTYYGTEGSSVAIELSRTRGKFGTLTVQYTVGGVDTDSALGGGVDYSSPGSSVTISPGQSSASVVVPIIDDNNPELQEFFSFELNSVTGGARLGNLTSAVVIIEPSDNPNGRVLFSSSDAAQVIDNPTDSIQAVNFDVLREDGTFGSIEVRQYTH